MDNARYITIPNEQGSIGVGMLGASVRIPASGHIDDKMLQAARLEEIERRILAIEEKLSA